MNKHIKRDATEANKIYNDRSLAQDFRTLIPCLKPGMKVLDVGCGTGAISLGITKIVGQAGSVTGIDNTKGFIENGNMAAAEVENLNLIHVDLFEFETDQKYDLIVAARMVQWLSTPKEALLKMKSMLKPGGQISILDYNHEALELAPNPPKSFDAFYKKWLQWRADAGMNNRVAEDLPNYFNEIGLTNIQAFPSNEMYTRDHSNFEARVGIWAKVAEMTQISDEGYMTTEERLLAVSEYENWVKNDAQQMQMHLSEVRGFVD